jgi:hypothetical protein
VPDEKPVLEIHGVGTHTINIETLTDEARQRLMECIRRNGKISIMVSGGHVTGGTAAAGFAQQID